MAGEATTAGATTGNPYAIAGGVALDAISGMFQGGQSTAVPKYQDLLQSLMLGELPPELAGMDIEQLLQQLGLSKQMMSELMNLPRGLSYDALSGDVLGGEGGGPLAGMDLANLPGRIGNLVNEGYDKSFQTAGQSLKDQLAFLQGESRRSAAGATEGITGALDALGLRGSTRQGTEISNALAGINAGYQNTVNQGQNAMGQFAAQSALGRAQGLQAGYGLQGNLAGMIGNLMLNQRQQQIGLRGQADSNRALLLSDPTFQNLFGMRQATGGQQNITQTQYSEFN